MRLSDGGGGVGGHAGAAGDLQLGDRAGTGERLARSGRLDQWELHDAGQQRGCCSGECDTTDDWLHGLLRRTPFDVWRSVDADDFLRNPRGAPQRRCGFRGVLRISVEPTTSGGRRRSRLTNTSRTPTRPHPRLSGASQPLPAISFAPDGGTPNAAATPERSESSCSITTF